MIRAVLDTNVLVSALISKKSTAPPKIYKAFATQQFLLITSLSIIEEFEDVINRKNLIKYHKLSLVQRKGIIEELVRLSYVTFGTLETAQIIIEKDPKDDKFIHAAIEGTADYIVSGDHHLLNLKTYNEIEILSPNNFLRVLEKQIKE